MFLSNRGVARQRYGRPLAGATLQANCPHGSAASSSLTYGCSFRPLATPEQLPSPSGRRWGRPPHRRIARPFRVAYRSGLPWWNPGTAWDFHRSVWTAIVSRRDHQSPRRPAATNRSVCCGEIPLDPHVLPQAWELGTPSRPKRGPSRTILAWPLRRRPLLDDAGCVPLRKESSSKDFPSGTAPSG
jgi:hypothetical protein